MLSGLRNSYLGIGMLVGICCSMYAPENLHGLRYTDKEQISIGKKITYWGNDKKVYLVPLLRQEFVLVEATLVHTITRRVDSMQKIDYPCLKGAP
jgi:hypothetical protein